MTDRIDLDDQIWRTFDACGKTAKRAKSGEELMRLIKEGKASVITAVINKFDTVQNKYGLEDANPNIFVLADEGHRSNYGETHAIMKRVTQRLLYRVYRYTVIEKGKEHRQKIRWFDPQLSFTQSHC